VKLLCRGDFPSYEVRDYEIRWHLLDADNHPLCQASKKLAPLKPGEEQSVEFHFPAAQGPGAASIKIEVVRPTGHVTADRTVSFSKTGGSL